MKNVEFLLVVLVLLLKSGLFAAAFIPGSTVRHSGTLTPASDYNASYAIDGNSSTCSLAAENSEVLRSTTFAWFQIDLGVVFPVISVTLTNGQKDYDYLTNFAVLVANTSNIDDQSSTVCYTYNNESYVPAKANITLMCSPNPLSGRYVTIKRRGGQRHDALSLCEIKIDIMLSDAFIHLKNLSTNQTGAYNGMTSNLAVDGNAQSCAQPEAPEGHNGWWSIDLLDNYIITSVIVYNNNSVTGSTNYLSYFEVKVGSNADVNSQTLCYNYNAAVPAGQNATINCSSPVIGRYLSLFRYGGSAPHDNRKTLYLCEIFIKGQIYDESTLSTSTSSATSSTAALASTLQASSTATISSSKTTTSSTTSSINTTTFSPISVSGGSPASPGATTNSITSADEDGKKNIIIICVVVIIGGILLLAVAGVALFLLIRRIRSKQGLSTKPEDGRIKPIKPPVAPKPNSPTVSQKERNVSTKGNLRQLITADLLADYVARKRSEKDGFKQEFEKLPKEKMEHVTLGSSSENVRRNRFKNILPYDHSLVPLEIEESDEPDANYINANYITGYKNIKKMYIASQGPKVETVVDFWRMIWQQNVDLIVMITCINEAGKKKCEQYWPDKVNETKTFNKISVHLTFEDTFANHVYREMTVQDERKESDQPRKVRHMHFVKWEDKTRPEHYLPVLCFRKRVQALQSNTSGPVVVHCSAGVGRTGTYIALDILLEQLKEEGEISFFSCVKKLRDQRMNMVQSWKQYDFLHEAVVDHFLSGETAIPCARFLRDYAELILPKPNGSKLLEQFRLLQKVKSRATDKESAGKQQENLSKNRNKDILAYDDARLYLETNRNNESDYINAVYVDGYRSNEAYILTQLPLQETIADFWGMVWDFRLKTIVLLNEIESGDQDCLRYWPEDGDTETHGVIEVKATQTTRTSSSVILREFTITHKNENRKGPLTVRHYQVKGWPNEAIVPSSPEMLLGLIGELTSISSNDSTVIQCTDGAVRSGLFAAAMYMIDMMKVEQVVDVFLACRFIAINRPQVISSQEQYKFLHDLASSYMNDTQDYSNYPAQLPLFKESADSIYANV